MVKPEEIARYRANLRSELDGAALYQAIAEAEPDPGRRGVLMELARAESRHAKLWREKLRAAGAPEPRFAPSLRTRLLALLARRFGPRFVMPSLAAAEYADRDKYASQRDAAALSADERGHASVVNALATGGTRPAASIGTDIARAEPWHRGASGNDLRAAVLGANDGLVSNFCLIIGVAGAGVTSRSVLLTGIAGLVAGACSMALGEWLSVTNARELAQTQIAREAEEIEQTPQAEQHELALIYQAKGLPQADAQRIAADLMRDKQGALDALTREELGIDPAELGGNPWSAAATSFLLFSLGACVPLLPFTRPFIRMGGLGPHAAWVCVGFSAVALATIGALTSLFNGRNPAFSASRQVVFGCAAAAVTYGVGRLLGVALS
ncbi:MAG TPA: VIT1/CCC1 transporter family protein [Steroidobacteraceae bacterium]|nr:VIT1/CCC1 transporter family protein [Steroidobacteraceae bacterium]